MPEKWETKELYNPGINLFKCQVELDLAYEKHEFTLWIPQVHQSHSCKTNN